MPKKSYRKKEQKSNLNFIASYLFLFPGVAASEVRRALYYFHNKKIDDGFNEKLTYVTYFTKPRNRKSYAGILWTSPSRTRWIIKEAGMAKINPDLFKEIKVINSHVAKKNSSYFNSTIFEQE
tara:strand:+ start:191 stop:559 length:369 start_codon:yes stop_codon:yes gene_type:complete